MADEQNKEWRELTFAQRAGEAPLPDALEVGKLSRQFRLAAWECVDASIERGWSMYDGNRTRRGFQYTADGRFWKAFVCTYFMEVHEIPHDKLPVTNENFFGNHLRTTILDGEVWDVLTAFEYMLRTYGLFHALRVGIGHVFEKSAYFLDASAPPICIMPSASEEGKKAMQRSLADLQKVGMDDAVNFLRESAQYINDGKYAASLWESIRALESVARKIAGKTAGKAATLGPALMVLANKKLLDAQLKSGIEKFYAYANKMARHAPQDIAKGGKSVPSPEKSEALLIYSTCASCAAYLAGKQRKIKTSTRPPDAT